MCYLGLSSQTNTLRPMLTVPTVKVCPPIATMPRRLQHVSRTILRRMYRLASNNPQVRKSEDEDIKIQKY